MTAKSYNHGEPGQPGKFPLAIALAIACVLALLVSVDPPLLGWIGVRLYVLVVTLAPGVLLALACIGNGDLFLRLTLRKERNVCSLSEWCLLSFACGMTFVSIIILEKAASQTFMFGQLLALLLQVIGVLLGLPLWKIITSRFIENIKALEQVPSRPEKKVFSSAMAALIIVTVAMVALSSLTPPIIFDVTEYHLGAWADYWQAHSNKMGFTPMPHNFYARFPFPIESLYYLGLLTTPGNDAAPKVFNMFCVLACAAMAGLLARRLGGGRNGAVLAALVTLAHPVMLDVSIDAMIDAPVALLVAGSVYAGFLAAGSFGAATAAMPRMLITSAFLFGTALSAKYTVAQVFLLPWVVLVLWPMLRLNLCRPKLLITAAVLAVIPCLFWLGKNVYFYGNPLEPFFVRWFRPGDEAGIAREQFYVESHFPQSPLTAEYWTSLLPRLKEFQWVLLVACAGWLFRGRNSAVLRILLFAAGGWLLWNLVRESQNRFLLPAMVLLAPVAATGAFAFPTQTLRRVVAAVLVFFAATQGVRYGLTLHRSAVMDYVLEFAPSDRFDLHENEEPTPRAKFYEENLGDLGRMINAADLLLNIPGSLNEAAKVLLIYEARPYLFPFPTRYNVVWDDSELLNIIRPADSPDAAWELLRSAGITHVLVNRQELLRYIQQYARPAQLRRLGVRPGQDPRTAWHLTATPQDLYPPFYRDTGWKRLRPIVNEMLSQLEKQAIIREGAPAPAHGLLPLDITLSSLHNID